VQVFCQAHWRGVTAKQKTSKASRNLIRSGAVSQCRFLRNGVTLAAALDAERKHTIGPRFLAAFNGSRFDCIHALTVLMYSVTWT